MSNTSSWAVKSETYRYSQDERALQWKFEKEIKPTIDQFIDVSKEGALIVGTYDLEKEPWRMAAILSYRKFNLKIYEKEVDGKTQITLVKVKTLKK